MENTKALPNFFIIKSGEFAETFKLPNIEETNIFKSGNTFGLISCLTGFDYLHRARTLTDCEIIFASTVKSRFNFGRLSMISDIGR